MATQTVQELETDRDVQARFEVNGFVNFGRILDPDELSTLSERIDQICDGQIEVPPECIRYVPGLDESARSELRRRDTVWQLLRMQQHDSFIRGICEKPVIQQACTAFLGGPVKLWSDQVLLKPAHHGSAIPWHQDSSYWGQEQRVTCWLAIDNATPENGCMRMIPGSHRRGQMSFTPKEFEGAPCNLLETDGVNEDTQVIVPVRAGCASFHHCRTLHTSSPNTTPRRRRAIAITYERVE